MHSGCCNKIPQTGWFINNRNLFFTVLGIVKSKMKLPADSVSGERLLLGSDEIGYIEGGMAVDQGYSHCIANASPGGGFSCCRAQALGHSGFSSWGAWA